MEAKDYKFYYPQQSKYAVKVERWEVKQGDICLLAGPSGCGKTTLLRQLERHSGWNGKEEGELLNHASQTAYVWQNPEGQIVTDKVEYEIVFPLENRGFSKEQMRRKLAEIVTNFGFEDLLKKDTMNLSGGEKQMINVAAAMITNPQLLLLDEPTSQLDPVATRKLYDMLRHINEEFGTTIIIAEQRLDEIVPFVDKMLMLEDGKVVAQGKPKDMYPQLKETKTSVFFPAYMSLFEHCVPLTKKEAREALFEEYEKTDSIVDSDSKEEKNINFISCKNISLRFDKHSLDILSKCSCNIPKEMITCLLGGNGSGKTTFLRVLSKQIKPYEGKVRGMSEKISYVPQNPSYLFLEETVCDELKDIAEEERTSWQMSELLKRHPMDLSGGEKQRLALCKVLSKEADYYLLDEPTKGLDYYRKELLIDKIRKLKKQGKTIIIVSHDMEFVAKLADFVAMMFDGTITILEKMRQFFKGNQFYTTAIHRIAGNMNENIVLVEDVKKYAKKK